MKKAYLTIALLLCTAGLTYFSQLQSASNYIDPRAIQSIGRQIESPMISCIDGAFPITVLVKFLKSIEAIIHHNHGQDPEKPITLSQLAKYEGSFPPEKKQAYVRKCITTLVEAARKEALFKMFDIARPFLKDLVEHWGKQHNTANGPFPIFIKKWASLGTEFDLLTSQIHTLTEYELYLTELRQFLYDLIVSCPKAYADYQRYSS